MMPGVTVHIAHESGELTVTLPVEGRDTVKDVLDRAVAAVERFYSQVSP